MSSSTAAARVPTRPIARPTSRERPQPRLRVVAPAPRRSAGGLALLSVGLLGIGLLVLLLLNISIGKGAYALTELQRQQRQLAEDRQALAEQVEAASAPDKLAQRALKLGMVPAPNTAFVLLPDGTVKGKPEVAAAPPKPVALAQQTAKKTVGALAAVAAAGKNSAEPPVGKTTAGGKTTGGKTTTGGGTATAGKHSTTAGKTPETKTAQQRTPVEPSP